MSTSVTKTVGVIFTGDVADLTAAMDTLVTEANSTSEDIVKAFADIGELIDAEWDDLGKTLGTTLKEQGGVAGKTGVDSIVDKYSTLGDDVIGEWDGLEKQLATPLTAAGDTAGEAGTKAIADKYSETGSLIDTELDGLGLEITKVVKSESGIAGEAGATALADKYVAAGSQAASELDGFGTEISKTLDTESRTAGVSGASALAAGYGSAGALAATELDGFGVEIGKTLDSESRLAGDAGAAALTAPFSAAGETAGNDFASQLKAALGGIDEDGQLAGGSFATGFDTSVDLDEHIKWPSVLTADADGAAAGKAWAESFDLWAKTDQAALYPTAAAGAGKGPNGIMGGAAEEEPEPEDLAEDTEGPEGDLGGLGGGGAEGFTAVEGGESAGGAGLLATIMNPEVLAPIIATVGSLWAAINLQDYEAKIAGAMNISVKAATAIGSSWEDMGGKSEFSANQMAEAFAAVAGQYQEVTGPGDAATKATNLFAAAATLATSSGDDLAPSMAAIVTILQAFKGSTVSDVGTVLYQLSEKSGIAIPAITTQLQKLHSKVGDLTPPLQQLGGFFLDMVNNGESGKAGVSAMSAAITALFKPTTNVVVAQDNLKTAFNATTGPSRTLANELANGKITSEQYMTAVEGLNEKQTDLANNFQSSYDKVTSANLALADSGTKAFFVNGKFVGLSTVIASLDKTMAHETATQQLATAQSVFGSSANAKLVQTILAGPAAFDNYTKSVSNTTDEQQAANKNAATLGGQFKTLEGGAADLGDKLGTALIPVLTTLMTALIKVLGYVTSFVGYLETHKNAAIAFGAAIAIAFAPVVGLILAPIAAIGLLVAAGVMLVNHWKTIETFFVNFGKSIWKTLDNLWHSVQGDVTTVWDAINHFFDGIPGKIVGLFLKWNIVSVLLSHWNLIESGAKLVWGIIMDFIHGVPGKIAGFFLKWSLLGTITTHFTAITSTVWRVWSAIVLFFESIPGTILAFFQKWTLAQLLSKAWTTIESTAKLTWNKIIAFIDGIPKTIQGVFSGALSWLLNVGQNIMAGLLAGLVAGFKDVDSFVSGIKDRVMKDIEHPFGLSDHPSPVTQLTGQNIMAGLIVGLSDSSKASSITGTLTSLSTTMQADLKPNIAAFTTLGQQMMAGLAAGIASGAAAAATAAANAATAALAAAKTATKTASPSQVFNDLGVSFMQGLAQGITGAAGLARSAVTGAVAGLTTPAALGSTASSHASMQAPQINITVESPSGTLPASTIAQIQQVVENGLQSFGSAWGNALRVSGG